MVDNRSQVAYLTSIYAYLQAHLRKSLWRELNDLVSIVGCSPWCQCLGGDMNCWLNYNDKRGGARFGTKLCKLFNN